MKYKQIYSRMNIFLYKTAAFNSRPIISERMLSVRIISILIMALCVFFCGAFAISVHASAGDSAYLEKPVVIIDAGHGGMDGGTTAGIRYEKTYNLLIAQYLRDALAEHGGFEVYMTRDDDDTDMKMLPRAMYIVTYNADLLLSLHCNSSDIASASGALAITSVIDKYSAFTLGESILSGINEKTGIRNRGVETRYDTGDSLGVYYWNSEKNWDMPGASYLKTVSDYFSMNTWSSKFGVPSLIIEHGYLSNSSDRQLMDKDETLKKFAEAEAEALINYYYGHTHIFTDEKVTDFPSNCSLTGTKSYHCTICGLKAETESLPPAPDAHFYRQSASKKATCETDGYIEYTCQISFNLNDKGYTTPVHLYSETLEKKGHSYRVTEDIPAGHGIDGRHAEYCDNCGDIIEQTTPGEPHSYEKSNEKPASCTQDGVIVYTCTVCAESYTEALPAKGHAFDSGGICTVCGYNSDNTAQSSNESTEKPETDNADTAENPADTDVVCSHIYKEKSSAESQGQPDGENKPDRRTEPDCVTDTVKTEACILCGDERTVTIPAPGHDYAVSMDYPAECEKDGFYRAKCRRCGDEIIKNIPAEGHDYEVESTDHESGEVTKVCRKCGARITETVERRSIGDILRNPIFIGICVIVAVQAVLIIVTHIGRKKRYARRHTEISAEHYADDN